MNDFNIHQWITVTGSTNGQEDLEERKGRIYKKPHIDLHNILQRRQRERSCYKKLFFAIDVKGGEKHEERKNKSMKIEGVDEYRGRNGHRGCMSVSVNAKGGDCWKFDCH
jgi:hypothetical protein